MHKQVPRGRKPARDDNIDELNARPS